MLPFNKYAKVPVPYQFHFIPTVLLDFKNFKVVRMASFNQRSLPVLELDVASAAATLDVHGPSEPQAWAIDPIQQSSNLIPQKHQFHTISASPNKHTNPFHKHHQKLSSFLYRFSNLQAI